MSKAVAVDIGYFPRWLWLLLEEENGGKKEQLKYLVKRTEQSVVDLVREVQVRRHVVLVGPPPAPDGTPGNPKRDPKRPRQFWVGGWGLYSGAGGVGGVQTRKRRISRVRVLSAPGVPMAREMCAPCAVLATLHVGARARKSRAT